ncbi:MAG: hypothetical protein EAZ51_02225 [Sphingobacteriales bacterium]|nr:MAG: hypothetical protein EAZ64_02170 [Sphingobacteriales bacterium]TAF82545.1 MAG: hypothetical protein EAZ51_02225 [Sphingobacteriales bacterium]
MKKITLAITLLMAVFAIYSCKKDKKDEVSILVGKKWELSEGSSSGSAYAELVTANISCPYKDSDAAPAVSKKNSSKILEAKEKSKNFGISPMYITFNADGTWINTFNSSFKSCLEGQATTAGQNGTWKIEGNKFTLNNMYKTMPTIVFTIKELTATSFKIEIVAPNGDDFEQWYEIYNPNAM